MNTLKYTNEEKEMLLDALEHARDRDDNTRELSDKYSDLIKRVVK